MSSRRERTRLSILEAAWKRLAIPGDAARLEDIAADAGVSRQAVYLHFGSRSALLLAVVEHIGKTLGLDGRVAELRKLGDPVEALEKSLHFMVGYEARIHPVAMALARLSPHDTDAREAFEDRMNKRREGLASGLRAVQRAGRLAPGWTAAKAADALWEAGAPSSYEHLVVERGWSQKDFARWLVHLARSFVVDAPAS